MPSVFLHFHLSVKVYYSSAMSCISLCRVKRESHSNYIFALSFYNLTYEIIISCKVGKKNNLCLSICHIREKEENEEAISTVEDFGAFV